MRSLPKIVALALIVVSTGLAQGELVAVISKPVSRVVELPGELRPFLEVSLHAKVPGFVERVTVDRGSAVRAGDLLVELSAPEIVSHIAEAESKVQAIALRVIADQLDREHATTDHVQFAAA